MVSVLEWSAVDREFRAHEGSNQRLYTIGICCFSVEPTALRSKNKDRLSRLQDNVSEWSVSTCLPADYCFSGLEL
jgi:hypothetical protein